MKIVHITVPAAAALALSMLAGASAQAASLQPLPPRPSVADAIKAAPASDWRPLDLDNTLYMDLPSGRVVIELAPNFAPNHARNIKALAREAYFDGLVILRSQDNFVVQWGDPDEEHPRLPKKAQAKLKAEFSVPLKNDTQFTRLKDVDGYAPQVGHSNGFPVGRDPQRGQTWLTHCYATVGVGRDNDPDSGGGVALYVVTGQAPRQLDRNITVVGRVVAGMPLLSTLPRGPAPMGFYDQPALRVPIQSFRVAADVAPAERSNYEVMRTDSASYQKVLEAQRNRGGPWNVISAKHVDLCNAPIPVREQK